MSFRALHWPRLLRTFPTPAELTQILGYSDKRNLFGEPGLDPDGNSRYFDSLLDFMLLVIPDPQGIHGLPMVEVVTGFSILRRNFRNVSATSLIPVLRSLPRLKEVRFEPWQQVDQPAQEDVDSGKHACLPHESLLRMSVCSHHLYVY